MFKYFFLLLLPFSNKTCNKEKISSVEANPPVAYEKEHRSLPSNEWQYFSEKDLTIKNMQPRVYEKTGEGLKIYADGYRNGARLSSSEKVCLENKLLYVKWKCEDGKMFNEYCVSLYYDKKGYGGDDNVRTDITRFTTDHSWNSSVVIDPDTWYFTRIQVVNDVAIAITAIRDYDTNGGTVIESVKTPLKETTGYVAIRVGDSYGSYNATVTLNSFLIRDNFLITHN
jgi:hypothetical protein